MKTVGWDGPVAVGSITLALSTAQGPRRLGNENGGVGRRVGQVSATYSLLPLPQRCFQTTNGYLSDSRSCSSNYNVAALATSSLVGRYQLLSPGVCVVHPRH